MFAPATSTAAWKASDQRRRMRATSMVAAMAATMNPTDTMLSTGSATRHKVPYP